MSFELYVDRSKGIIYDLYGILNDYLIDTNKCIAINGPVYNYNNFQTCRKWQIAKVTIKNRSFLIADIEFKGFSYFRYIKCEKMVLLAGLNSKEALYALKEYSYKLEIDILDQMEYYLSGNLNTITI